MGGKGRHAATPVHTVYLDDFWIDIYEVTNAQFKTFIDANPQWSKDNIPNEYHNGNYLKLWNGSDYPNGKANHPVVYVSWYAAMAYAQWVGKRLPTEAEWEKAARGGAVGKRYVWGDLPDPSKSNYIHHGNPEYTSPVGNYPPNGYGLYDMGGNVWELCLDEYDAKFYRRSADKNPIAGASDIKAIIENFTDVQTARVARGGSWVTPGPAHTADRGRDAPTNTNGWLGFRCAKTMTAQEREELSKQNTENVRDSSSQTSKYTSDSEESYQEIAENSRDAVVYIEALADVILTLLWRIHKMFTNKRSATYTNLHRFLTRIQEGLPKDKKKGIGMTGTGFFIAPDMLVTNIHVVVRAKTVAAKQFDSEEPTLYSIEGVMAFDAKNDLVVLKIPEECATSLSIGNSDDIQAGDSVCTVTYANAEFTHIKGTISSTGKDDKFHQIKTQLSPGNSGSPVLNSRGQVIGVAVSTIGQIDDSTSHRANAIPSNTLNSLLERVDEVESFTSWQRRPSIRAYVVSHHADTKREKGKYKEAIAKYDAALKLNPDLLTTYLNRGGAKLKCNDYEGAIADCNTALELNSDFISAYTNRAVAKMALYEPESTLEDINFAFEHLPGATESFQSYLIRASAKAYLGDLIEAIEDVDKSITIKPDFAEGFALRGELKIQLGDCQEALEDAEKAIQLKPKSGIAYVSRANAKQELGKFEADQGEMEVAQGYYQEALGDANKAIQLKSDSNAAFSTRGRAKQCLGKSKADQGDIEGAKELYNAAIADHTKSIEIRPRSATAYNARGWAKYLLGQLETEQGNAPRAQKHYQAAIVDSDQAIRLAKDTYYAYSYYHTRGAVKAALADYDKAIEDFGQAIRLKPTHILSYRDRAKAKEALGATDAAKADLQKITQIHIDLAKNCFQEGQAKYQQHEYKAALACFDKALMLNPKYAGAYSNRGMAKSAIGRSESRKRNRSQAQHHFQEAIADYTEAITQNPKYASAYNNRGNAKYRLGLSESDSGNSEKAREHYQDAITDLDKAIQLNPKHVKAHNNRGKVKKALGQQAAAEADYKKAKALEAAD